MNTQPELDFTSSSPINVEKLTGENKRLYDWLKAHNTIHLYHPAKRQLRIGFINSRISDIKKAGVFIYKRMIKITNDINEIVDIKEYSMYPFNDLKLAD